MDSEEVHHKQGSTRDVVIIVQIAGPEKKGFEVLNQNCMDSLEVLGRYVALNYQGQKSGQESAENRPVA
jgi:hypothetical protein